MKKSKQKTTTLIVIMFAIVLAAGVGFWAILEHSRGEAQNSEFVKSDNEEVNNLVKKDLKLEYPGTPREVLKMYSRLQSCAYNQGLSNNDLEAVINQMRILFDEELLAANSITQQITDIKKDISKYVKEKKTISNYVVDKDSSIEEKKVKGKEYASAVVSYLVKDEKGYSKTFEQFVLRKDTEGKWKILGWKLVADKEDEN